MIWTILLILMVLWTVVLVTANTMGGFLHILLVLALVTVAIRLTRARRVV